MREWLKDLENLGMSIAEIAQIASALGVALVALQLLLGRLQTRTALEDDLAREYREIAARLPAAAFFDERDPLHPLPPLYDHIEEFVRYLDLTNQQIFLRVQRRVSSKTWELWRDGIRDNLGRSGFEVAWTHVRRHSPKSYNELASLYDHWEIDPGWWSPPWWGIALKRLKGYPDQPEAWRPGS